MKILLIEDEESLARSIKRGLELKSYVVDLALDGEVGYDLASSEEYDLLIIDWMLPKTDGLTLCKKLRDEKNHTPILILTAKTMVADRVSGLDSGADDYLGKPFAFVELLARIKALTRRHRTVVSPILQVADLTLDTQSKSVIRGSKKIFLSPKEYSLLEFLLRNRGRVFDKDELARRVWSFDDNVLANTAQVYIGYLRKKVDRDFPKSEPLISTVRGFGYTIAAKK